MSRRGRGERGFTLVELLLSVTILTIISAAVTGAFIIGLRTTDNTSSRLGESSDALLLATYFGSDAQSADASSSTTDTACAGVIPVVRLKWADPGVGDRVVSYALVDGSLVRHSCLNGALLSRQTLVRDVTAATCSCAGSVLSLSIEAGGFTYQVDGRRRAG